MYQSSGSAEISESASRKRLRRSKESNDTVDVLEQESAINIDERLFDIDFPKHYESAFAIAIFELGLKHSSPKIIMVSFLCILPI